ncbi:uncharacterized protein LOC127872415 [Dreissena polymorpha]|uniref:uncharacterized protein LOC127872415 n=1 Tax=Dreissena polymorpha TaxID=45954 RepID=UPI002264BAF3|nr:uncharacterized protein LOC127872415 [Dreissena polymorpha]
MHADLPRFSVDVLLPPAIMDTDTIIPISVRSRFTFNANVHGNCTLYFHRGDMPSHFETSKEIQGIANFKVPMSQVRVYRWWSDLKLRVIVTDNGTELSYAVEKEIIIQEPHSDVFQLKQIVSRRGVNGLNYTTSVKLMKNGKSPGIAGTLFFNVTYHDEAVLKCMQANPQHDYDYIKKSQSFFSAQTHFGVNGVAEVSFPVHSTTEKIEWSVGYNADAKLFYQLYLEQQSKYMLWMQFSGAELEVGKVIEISVATMQPIYGLITMEVYNGNTMVDFVSKTVIHQSNLTMNLALTNDMVPLSYIVVSHVTKDGYILSDSAYIDVDGLPMKNKMDLQHNSTSVVKPGDYVGINITTDPYSTVYLMVGNEGNRLLETENDILPREIAEIVTLSDGRSFKPNRTDELPTACVEWTPVQTTTPQNWYPGSK